MKPVFLIAIVAVAMFVLVFNVDESYGSFSPVLPIYIEDDVPTIAEFKKMNQNVLLKNHAPHSILRDNGEKIDTYLFYEKSKGIRIITYVEDSTDEQLKNYIPFTTDHLLT